MKRFICSRCRNAVHFENSVCVNCGATLGFLPDNFRIYAVSLDGNAFRLDDGVEGRFRFCENYASGACNWLVPASGPQTKCVACRHNHMIPDLALAENARRWRRLEQAKRRLFYSLLRWRLPLADRAEDPRAGLAFDFIADAVDSRGNFTPVMTGHADGMITINIAEADDSERERRRAAIGEPYRTLLGHFRHEIGHYYWDRLVRDGGRLDQFRDVFGDERADYEEALRRHYAGAMAAGPADGYISSYSSAHPWEDFAETWAHYMHIVDVLETSRAFALEVASPGETLCGGKGRRVNPYRAAGARELVGAWVPLTVAVNDLNRSMGLHDLYPFVLSQPVIHKLQFAHDCIFDSGRG